MVDDSVVLAKVLADLGERRARKVGSGLEAKGVDELLVVRRWPEVAQGIRCVGMHFAQERLETDVICGEHSDKYQFSQIATSCLTSCFLGL
jgi:hypothetical protein